MKHYSIITAADGKQKLHSRTSLSNKETADRLTERLQAGRRMGGHGAPVKTVSAQSLQEIEHKIRDHNRQLHNNAPLL